MIDPDLLLRAYASGWFPMGTDDGRTVEWFSPDPRGILPIETFHVPRRLARVLRRGAVEVCIDQAFASVVAACARRGDTWINDEIFESYVELHRLGVAHSVETWRGDRLVGGLYGVSLGGAFFGESMFHDETDASKVALVALVERLRARDYLVLDVQWVTEHLRQFGAIEIPRRQYLDLLETSVRRPCAFV